MEERRLGILLATFFAALAIPSVVLVAQAFDQLKWQAFRQTQLLAEDLAGRINADLRAAVAAEDPDAVMAALAERGVAPDRMEAHGAGWLAPVAANDTEAGRALNRRVELVLR